MMADKLIPKNPTGSTSLFSTCQFFLQVENMLASYLLVSQLIVFYGRS
jgi:hypothetical protein